MASGPFSTYMLLIFLIIWYLQSVLYQTCNNNFDWHWPQLKPNLKKNTTQWFSPPPPSSFSSPFNKIQFGVSYTLNVNQMLLKKMDNKKDQTDWYIKIFWFIIGMHQPKLVQCKQNWSSALKLLTQSSCDWFLDLLVKQVHWRSKHASNFGTLEKDSNCSARHLPRRRQGRRVARIDLPRRLVYPSVALRCLLLPFFLWSVCVCVCVGKKIR